MSIFRKMPIEVGDLVIGVHRHRHDPSGPVKLHRIFVEPSIVIEIKDDKALVYFEQFGPKWYNINTLEKVYVAQNEKVASRHP